MFFILLVILFKFHRQDTVHFCIILYILEVEAKSKNFFWLWIGRGALCAKVELYAIINTNEEGKIS